MTNFQSFCLNGNEYFINSKLTLLDLIKYFNYNESLLILEHNHLICNKTDWPNILIKNNDKIEILTIVGGG